MGTSAMNGGGGGGGAGRIRVSTPDPSGLTGVFSPDNSSDGFSTGPLTSL